MISHSRFLSSLATIRRTRTLPVAGTVLRRVGDKVAADIVVAEADQRMGYRLLDLQVMLGKPVSDARKVLVKQQRGASIEAGEVLARTGLWRKAECVSPVTGTILDARGGKVLIEVAPQHVQLTAFYPGTVIRVLPDRGVVLDVTGAVIQGVWGTGGPFRARIHVGAPDGETPLQVGQISPNQMGTILLGGRTLDRAAVEQAVEAKIAGVVVGSISSELVPVIEATSLAVIVTEGLGGVGMNARTFELLRSYAGREVCFNPQSDAPEIVVPLPADARADGDREAQTLRVGTQVRALRSPYLALTGAVVSLPPNPRRIESGILAMGAWVDMEIVGKVFVPLDNLEIVA
ncbi:MAG: hypothetical protein JW934_01055 [Anaerolineae bacterium]|nr:hypothetical protein [Anaerolineae bacterium]